MQRCEVGIPYSISREWTDEEKEALPKCEWCDTRCYNIFMQVYIINRPSKVYCSPNCWHEGREVVYHEVNPKKKGNFSREVSRLKDNE